MKRCAIYTRKSTEEGLEQDFNSLHAQREACEAFIKSQKHEGWKQIRTHYDDGGYSGGTMDRPALADLMDAIRARQVDVVVVYKVDRLTRSLADFAKLVELFDAQGVSFVSVTQQFNTTSSMGRLTLNVLLSFAQFEREVTAERIRDKIAASKKKGIWMGGPVPLGYDIENRKLIVNRSEAEAVRTLYRLYLDLGTVRAVKDAADRMGIVTKIRVSKSGRRTGGKPFSRGNLYVLLSNPTYIGHLPHKGDHHPALHDAIVDRETWDAVQAKLQDKSVERRSDRNGKSTSLLAGLVYDETGDILTPSHAAKQDRRYRYYVSNRLIQDADKHKDGWRLRAATLETAVIDVLSSWVDAQPPSISQDEEFTPSIRMLENTDDPLVRRNILRRLVERIDLSKNEIAITLKGSATIVREAICLKRRGIERKIVLPSVDVRRGETDPVLCRMIGQAHAWIMELASGAVPSVDAIAEREGRNGADVSGILQLAFLAPDIVEAILDGRHPIDLTPTVLTRLGTLPGDWTAQRHLLGFAA